MVSPTHLTARSARGRVTLPERFYDLLVSAERPRADTAHPLAAGGDSASTRWVEELDPDHPCHEQAVANLHEILRRAAFHELHRRRYQVPGLAGPEFEDLAHQCADDALVNILANVDDFKGLSRFTTWAYKFAIFEVSDKLSRHAWQRHPPGREEFELAEFPDRFAPRPNEQAERREQLAVLRNAIEVGLTPRQREVFVAIALNNVPVDVLAFQLSSNRNAIYKSLFDARRKLRQSLADAGHPLTDQEATQ